MKTALKVLLGLVLLFAAFALYVHTSWHVNLNEEYPITEVSIAPDSAMLAHGKYLAEGPAHCTHCHLSMDQLETAEAGNVVMKGGFEFGLPIGKWRAPNITPDPETGIGRYTDGELYRLMRHNILPSGRATIDLMPFTTMSEYDVKSILAYLRIIPPIKNEVPITEPNFLGKALLRFVIRPVPPKAPIEERVEKDSSIVYGKYLAESVANCRGCHTKRDLKTGEYIGPFYAGGLTFEPAIETGMWTFNTPNLTSDPATGIMADWTEATFINRFKVVGRFHKTSPMPWGAFKQMDEIDLKAIYRFLKSLPPVENKIEPVAIAPTIAE